MTAQYYLRAREYDPAVGRFLSRDTWAVDMWNPVEVNRYVYAAANPVTWSDPTGLTTTLEWGSTTIAVVGAGLLLLAAVTPSGCLPYYFVNGIINLMALAGMDTSTIKYTVPRQCPTIDNDDDDDGDNDDDGNDDGDGDDDDGDEEYDVAFGLAGSLGKFRAKMEKTTGRTTYIFTTLPNDVLYVVEGKKDSGWLMVADAFFRSTFDMVIPRLVSKPEVRFKSNLESMRFTGKSESITEYELKELYGKYRSRTDFYDLTSPGGTAYRHITGPELEERVRCILNNCSEN